MSKRNLPRIDYNLLNSIGQVKEVNLSTSDDIDLSFFFDQLSINEMPSETAITTQVIIQEVDDVIDENNIIPEADIDGTVARLNELRNILRRNHILLQTEDANHELL